MDVVFTKSFLKDIRKIEDKQLARAVEVAILSVKSTSDISDIKNIKKLKGHRNAFRIRIGDYRLGLFVAGNKAEFACFLNRKDIYKFFP